MPKFGGLDYLNYVTKKDIDQVLATKIKNYDPQALLCIINEYKQIMEVHYAGDRGYITLEMLSTINDFINGICVIIDAMPFKGISY